MSDSLSLTDLKKMLEDQQRKIEILEKRVISAEKQAEAAEQYSRQDCLIFRGKINIRPGYNLRDEVMRLIEQHTGVRFPSWCMNTVHWLSGGQSLIVRFNNKSVREEIYRNRVPKSPEKRGLFIHESLTPSKMALVSRCAKLRNEGKIMTYYTQGGNVMVKKSKNTPGVLVTPGMTDDDIDMKLKSQPSTYRDAVTRTGEQVGTRATPDEVQPAPTEADNNTDMPEVAREVTQDGLNHDTKEENGTPKESPGPMQTKPCQSATSDQTEDRKEDIDDDTQVKQDGLETTSEEKNTGKEEKEGEKDKVEDEKQTQGEAVADTACEEQTLSQKDKQTASQAGHDSPVSSPGHRLSKKRRQALKRVH